MQQDVRYRSRIGSHQPYRDDPNAPVQLESFAHMGGGGGGAYGYGNPAAMNPMMDPYDDHWKKQQQSTAAVSSPPSSPLHCLPCCGNNSSTTDNDPRYYRDDFNDYAWTCNFGTTDEDGIWLNQSDPAGTIMAMMVWILLGYSCFTITCVAQTGGIPPYQAFIYTILVAMALACHVKTSLTDPGSVPAAAVPTEAQRKYDRLSMCSQCQTFKPPLSHHCRICNRCISRMDHHCPWMNNCVGAGNLKHFFLFLLYTWSCSGYCLLLLGYNYFFCAEATCEFNLVLTQLVRIMTVLCVGAFLFTSSMIMNVIYGILTGIGTIDRLKKKATDTMGDSEEEPIPLTDIFGIGPWYTWPLPVDPLFDDYDRVMGFSTPQRLLREEILREQRQPELYDPGVGGGVAIGDFPPV